MSFKVCPSCNEQRPHHELFCNSEVAEGRCGWDLTDVPLDMARPDALPTPKPEVAGQVCANGHSLNLGDFICGICGSDIASGVNGEFGEQPQSEYEPQVATDIAGWELLARLDTPGTPTEVFRVRGPDGAQGLLTLYPCGVRPDAEVNTVVDSLAPNIAARIWARGIHEERSFEVAETLDFRTFSDVVLPAGDLDDLRATVRVLGQALHAVSRAGIRHRDLRPHAILPEGESGAFKFCRFGSALLSSHDLDNATPLELTRYMAPEILAGAVSPASDWWSIGIILLEKLTQGACFEGISDQAFLINVVANGADVPETLDPNMRLLLRGLLARDRIARWKWEEVEAWTRGEPLPAPDEAKPSDEQEAGSIVLGGCTLRTPSRYALAAGSAENWAEARDQLARGAIATWLEEFPTAEKMRSALRTVMRREEIDDDTRLSVALKILNPVMPLVRTGKIITPQWLLQHPVEGYDLISRGAPELLEQLGQEFWLAQLQRRASDVRRRAEQLDIELVEDRLRINLLCTSRLSLEGVWDELRESAPDSDHKGLASVMDRPQLTDVDLIVLASASRGQFRPLQEVLQSASELARREGVVTFDPAEATALFKTSRRDVLRQVGGRLENFARCGIQRVDEWADQFRLERRTSLQRAAVILSLPQARWKQPPGQEYVSQLLGFFEKRINVSVSRGALARMTITKTSPRIDVTELGTQRESAARLLDHLLERSDIGVTLDPSLFAENEGLERRLRMLVSRAELLRRETGINGLYMGFPFILAQPRGEAVKPRIAPVLLWPIKIGTEVGQRARFTLGFDRDREDVRINPALQSVFSPQELANWNAARENILAGVSSTTSVMDELTHLSSEVRQGPLTKLPGPDVKVVAGAVNLLPAAVLFHVTFVGQAIVEDIRHLRAIPPAGSSLETLLRVQDSDAKKSNPPPLLGDDIDRYTTAESDPTQDRAVVQARSGPGLVIEGPPGTGKSQTIVNMVADAIGRKKSILIICQKQAALDVVCKRLQREGLEDRLVMVTDLVRDRRPVIEAIRVQVEGILLNGAPDTTWQRQRRAVLDRIKRFEDQLNAHQRAMHEREDVAGLTYRELVAELVAIEDVGTHGDSLELRERLGRMPAEQVAEISETCAALGRLWLPSEYENSALSKLKPFGWDTATITRFHKDFEHFCECERRRCLVERRTPAIFEVDDADEILRWLAVSRDILGNLADQEAEELAYFVDFFVSAETSVQSGPLYRQQLSTISQELVSNPGPSVECSFEPVIAQLGDGDLDRWIGEAAQLTHPASFMGRLSPSRYMRRRRLKRLLQSSCPAVDDALLGQFLSQARHEKLLRGMRTRINQICTALGFSPIDVARATSGDLAAHTDWLSATLHRVAALSEIIAASPVSARTLLAAKDREPGAFERHFEDIDAALARCAARKESLYALTQLERWFERRWLEACKDSIAKGKGTSAVVAPIVGELATLPAYQQFRIRADRLNPEVHAVFEAMRSFAPELRIVEHDGLEDAIRQLLRREACLGWKAGFEAANPILLVEHPEVEGLVRSLAEAEAELRAINKRAIRTNIDPKHLGTRDKWEDITRLTGPRARRLREFVEAGWDIGLRELRPVWLMSPDVASRMLPIRQMFDTVVYDEASQMPVEFALPSLFRGKAVIVSGDEKQLPPTSFFANRVESDEDEAVEFNDAGDDLDEEDQQAATEMWNRREIKDCPNLLDLSKSVLPTVMLQVHYRSAFRELISFSNNAFYDGELNVPVRHPEKEVDRERPLEVVRVDGLYHQRTNGDEAKKVVELLASIWKTSNPPSVGVVTFNRDQADLIELGLEERAEEDAAFRAAYSRELNRMEAGEDMGFFVKNVENVQGDERDQIIFSTTFGRNQAGAFRRYFGVLGQSGGERRLNVAITRARKKVTLVTSMPIDRISDVMIRGAKPERPRDFLQLYLAYASALSRGDHKTSKQYLRQVLRDRGSSPGPLQTDLDGLATSVASYVRSLGVEPTHANDGSAFGVDFAIRHPERGTYGIGIECEGHVHPILTRARAREIWRRSVMRKSIPVIHRVSLRGWYHDRSGEQARLRNAVEQALK